jgi:hypothetical protein
MLNNIFCNLGSVAAGAIVTSSFAVPASIEVMLFTEYMPGSVMVISNYPAVTVPAAFGAFSYIEATPAVDLDLAGISTMTPDSSPVSINETAKGATTTNGVEVYGSVLDVSLADLGLEDGGGALEATPRLFVQAPGATVRAPVNVVATDATNNLLYNQVILDETDYTQAMADANNTFTYDVGANTFVWSIVGIYAT